MEHIFKEASVYSKETIETLKQNMPVSRKQNTDLLILWKNKYWKISWNCC